MTPDQEFSIESIISYLSTGRAPFSDPIGKRFQVVSDLVHWLMDEPLDLRLFICSQIPDHDYVNTSYIPRILHDLPDAQEMAPGDISNLLSAVLINVSLGIKRGEDYSVLDSTRGYSYDKALAIKLFDAIEPHDAIPIIKEVFRLSRNRSFPPYFITAFKNCLQKRLKSGPLCETDVEAIATIFAENKGGFDSDTLSVFLASLDDAQQQIVFNIILEMDALASLEPRNHEYGDQHRDGYIYALSNAMGKDKVTDLLIEGVKRSVSFEKEHLAEILDCSDSGRFFSAVFSKLSYKVPRDIPTNIGNIVQAMANTTHENIAKYPDLAKHIAKGSNLSYYLLFSPSANATKNLCKIGVDIDKDNVIDIVKKRAVRGYCRDKNVKNEKSIRKDPEALAKAETLGMRYLISMHTPEYRELIRAIGLDETQNILSEVKQVDIPHLRGIFDDMSSSEFAKTVKGSSRHVLSDDLGL